MGSSDSQIYQYGHESETYELEHLSYVPLSYHLRNFPEVGFPSSPKGFSQLIARKCEGLQTATVSILCQKEWWRSDSSELKDEWEARIPSYWICGELKFVQQVFGTLYRHLHRDEGHELDRIQRVSEILCQDDHLFCFLCLSIFPENSQINCKRISCLWAAEGFLPDLGRAEHFMNDLLGRECIHPVKERSDGELHTFRLDKRVREIIVSLSRSCELLKISRQESTHSPGRVRLLHVKGKIMGLNTERTFTLSWTFMLDVSSNEDKIATYEAWPLETSNTPLSPVNLKHSKVLVLTGTPFQTIPNALFELSDVRYLSLGNTSVKAIPGSIGKLTHLEFLDAKHSLITKLPQQVERLKKIRHIRIYHHKKDALMESYNLIGFKASCSIRGLERLEKLCFVESDYSILEDLGNLTKLRQLGITKLRNGHGELFCSSLNKLEGLKSLNVHAFDEDEIIDILLLSSPPKYLKHLYLHGRLERLPDWISSLDVLTKIILRGSQLEEDLLAALGKLPELVELELRRAYNGTQLDFKNEQFAKLKILLLDELKGLRSMSLEQGTMPRLENLTISCCQWLERIPSGIEHITAIRKLTFFDMPHEFYEMIPADYENDRNLEHIREVYFTQWVSGHRETHQFDRVTRAWQVNTE
ncbi:hypothetical protein BT93_L4570 [Corymbia citriodora subsp. variegata]|uniref:Disease resistance R13L4/SHOC-2-like LRR domain-containing protein n=1 Tax=Corymbia citriodora subsp. variegata TaxID=360336 RepID=A0A8T0D104_CORYI|nr:hypothetical protein BT93_L4570 [Corymbia citriodora subsp. variegata]